MLAYVENEFSIQRSKVALCDMLVSVYLLSLAEIEVIHFLCPRYGDYAIPSVWAMLINNYVIFIKQVSGFKSHEMEKSAFFDHGV